MRSICWVRGCNVLFYVLQNKQPLFYASQFRLNEWKPTSLYVVLLWCSRWGQGSSVGGHRVQDQLHLLPHLQGRQSGGPLHGPGQRPRPRRLAGNWTSESPVCHFLRHKKAVAIFINNCSEAIQNRNHSFCLWFCCVCASFAACMQARIKWTVCSICSNEKLIQLACSSWSWVVFNLFIYLVDYG